MKEIKINNIIDNLEQIDLYTIIAVICPYIITLISNKRILNNINLDENTLKIESHGKIELNYFTINEEEILKKELGNLIIDFLKTLKTIPGVNTAIVMNNFNTLTTVYKDFKESNSKSGKNTIASYTPLYNKIELSKDNFNETIYHELLHASSAYVDKNKMIVYCGFSQINNTSSIGEALNEGYTQRLTEEYFKKTNQIIQSYYYEKLIAELIEDIVGKEKMQKLYFNADLNGLINELSKYTNIDEIHNFLMEFDYVNSYIHKDKINLRIRNILQQYLNNITKFLIKTALRKNNKTNSKEDIISSLEKTVPFFEKIDSKIIANNKYKFTVVNKKTFYSAISDIFKEYDFNYALKIKIH